MKIATYIALAALLSGCATRYHEPIAPVTVAPAPSAAKAPGKFALYVDGSGLETSARVRNEHCSAHTYPVSAGEVFEAALVEVVAQRVATVERVQSAVPAAELATRGFDGQIIARGVDAIAGVTVTALFMRSSAEGDVELQAEVEAYTAAGAALSEEISARSTADAPMEGCDTPAKALAAAAGESVGKLARQFGERLSRVVGR